MAQFTAKRLDESKINGGNRYNVGDGVSEEAINAPIEGVLYAQTFLDIALEKSQAALDGFYQVKEKQLEQDKKIDENSQHAKILYNIVKQKEFIDVVEVEQAYTSRETAAGQNIVDEQDTDVIEIKGKTVSCENLIPYPYKFDPSAEYPHFGISFSTNYDGGIVLNGQNNGENNSFINIHYTNEYLVLRKGTYAFSCGITGNILLLLVSNNGEFIINNNSSVNIPNDVNVTNILFLVPDTNNTVFNNVIAYPMLNEGSTALPYQPYFTGLKHAYINSIKSTGRNLIPYPYNETKKTENEVTFTSNEDGSVTINGTPTVETGFVLRSAATPLTLSAGTYIFSLTTSKPVSIYAYCSVSGGDTLVTTQGAVTYAKNVQTQWIVIAAEKGVHYDNVTVYPMLSYGTTALPYEPYTEETYQLPQKLELGEFDSFNPQTGEVVRATKEIVITGEEPRWYLSDAGTNSARFGHGGLAIGAVGGSYRISNKDVFGVTQIEVYSSGWVDIYDTRYKSVEEWTNYLKSLNAAGTPLRIAYKLETPTTETIANAPKGYKVHNHGTETVNQGETDNSKFGAMPTITNEYMIIL